jgi:hypothetical protein
MSKHVWLQSRLGSDRVGRALNAYMEARRYCPGAGVVYSPLAVPDALRFVGYYLERSMQAHHQSPRVMLYAAARGGLRFVSGKNRHNYLRAGLLWRRIWKEGLASVVGLQPDAPWYMVADSMDDHGYDSKYLIELYGVFKDEDEKSYQEVRIASQGQTDQDPDDDEQIGQSISE